MLNFVFYFQVLGCCIYPANKFVMVMNVKMPTIVGILTFMTIIVGILTFNDYDKFMLSLVEHEKVL